MSRRTIRKALLDAERLVVELGIKNQGVISVSAYGWCESSIHLRPAEFIRVFQLLRVRRSTMKAEVGQTGHLHAEFTARQTRFVCMVRRDSPEFEALANAQRSIEGSKQPRIGQAKQQLLIGSSS